MKSKQDTGYLQPDKFAPEILTSPGETNFVRENPDADMVEIERYASELGNIKIVKRLGKGAFGSVYECDTDNGKMACKFFFEDNLGMSSNTIKKQFVSEASIYSYMGNRIPGVCGVRKIGPGFLGMCLERTDLYSETKKARYALYKYDRDIGEFLDQKLEDISEDIPLLSEEYILESMARLLTTLEIMHSMNIAHLDIKPANILLDRDGNWNLCDFGISRKIRDSDYSKFLEAQKSYMIGKMKMNNGEKLIKYTSLTDADTTISYAPPESHVIDNFKPIYTVSDIWSVGILFYELLTGIGFLDTFLYRDKDGKITIREIITRISDILRRGFFEDDILSAIPLQIARFLTDDMKRSTLDFYDEEWEHHVSSFDKYDSEGKVIINTVSPYEILRIMRPHTTSRHSDIWSVLVNMLDPNPLTRYTAAKCLNTNLFKPYAYIRSSMWAEYIKRNQYTPNNLYKVRSSYDNTYFIKFTKRMLSYKSKNGYTWIETDLKYFPGIKERIKRLCYIMNYYIDSRLRNLDHIYILFFCICVLAGRAEYGKYAPGFATQYDEKTNYKEISSVFAPSSKLTKKESMEMIKNVLYYMLVNVLKFNLWA